METSLIDKIITNDQYIPNFELVRQLLYNLFAIETGPACTLIVHYYISGRNSNDKEFLTDPADQASWCIQNLGYFSKVAKRIRQVRNKLVHNEPLTFTLFKTTVNVITELSNKPSNAKFLIDLILTQINLICEIIISGKNSNKTCPLCGSHTDKEINLLPSKKTDLSLLEIIESKSLRYLKENGWKDKIKGSRIKILEGKWTGYEATFRSWSGTVCYADVQGIGRKSLHLDILVSII